MPGTPILVVIGLVVVAVVVFLLTRSKSKGGDAPRFEPPRELAPQKATAKGGALVDKTEQFEKAPVERPAVKEPSLPPPQAAEPIATPKPASAAPEARVETPTSPPPSSQRPSLRSYSSIKDEAIAEELSDADASAADDLVADDAPLAEVETTTPKFPSAPKAPKAPPPPPKFDAAAKAKKDDASARDAAAKAEAEAAEREAAERQAAEREAAEREAQRAAAKEAAEKAAAAREAAAKEAAAKAAAAKEAAAKEAAAKAAAAKEAAEKAAAEKEAAEKAAAEREAAEKAAAEREAAEKAAAQEAAAKEAPKPTAAATAAGIAARLMPPPNPATAELEKNDPRHAAARRLARVSVSEIKLYHEDEVKAGREAKDLWTRLQQDIALARQTFDARVVAEVRERFDYLLDELVRQLAEGDASKLGPGAPTLKDHKAEPAAEDDDGESEVPTRTALKTVEEAPAKVEAPAAKFEAPATAKPEPAAVAKEAPTVAAKVEEAPKPAATPAATGLAARGIAQNPATAELEKGDPRHAAARRLARLSVSEIKLYHEDEVKAGREAKDLWKRMGADIGLAIQTYEKRVDKDVRERYDYLYDEILRQLAEGDVAKLGPDAPPPPKNNAAPAAAAPAAVPSVAPALAPAVLPSVAPALAPAIPSVPPAPAAAPAVSAPPPAAAAPAAAPAVSPAGRYAPPTNPATAELEKNDPRHAAARRLARLSVSEIKLYHEDEVKAGREAKDLWKRMSTDIGLALQTYEKRVDKEVRERFDYLFDEILRQLAEGDLAKLGPEAPKPKA